MTKNKHEYLKILYKVLFQIEENIQHLAKKKDVYDHERCDTCHQLKEDRISYDQQQNFKLTVESLIEEYLEKNKMQKYIDKNNKILTSGDIINIHQTVNGQNIFIMLSLNPLDIRYGHNINHKYEYDKENLLKPCKYQGITEYEIIGNIYDYINTLNIKIDYTL